MPKNSTTLELLFTFKCVELNVKRQRFRDRIFVIMSGLRYF